MKKIFSEDDYLELYKYVNLDGTEFGYATQALLDIWEHHLSVFSDEFGEIVEMELAENLEWYRENTKIVDKEVTTVDKWQELEYVDEGLK